MWRDERPEPVACPHEHVRHHEDAIRHSPGIARRGASQRLLPGRIAQEAPGCPRSPHTVAGPFRPDLGVAVVAGRGDLRATPPRVERVIRPFDGRVLCHDGCRILRVSGNRACPTPPVASVPTPCRPAAPARRRRDRWRARFRSVAILDGECIGRPSGNVESILKAHDFVVNDRGRVNQMESRCGRSSDTVRTRPRRSSATRCSLAVRGGFLSAAR